VNPLVFRLSRFAALVAAKLLFGFRSFGRERVPADGPVLIVANHASFLDPPLLGVDIVRPVRYLARDTLAKLRLARWWLVSVGTVLIDRDAPSHRMLDAGIRILREGGVFAMFPEGTRTKDGAVQEFKRGVLLLVRQTGAAVVPAGIRGTFRSWPRTRKLPRPFVRCEVHYGEPMTAEQVLANDGLADLRRRIAGLAAARLGEADSHDAGSLTDTKYSSATPAGGQPAGAANPEEQPGVPAALPSRPRRDGASPAC
jgi:1-acyl-sn-glycerol-3-phosphate acyltransferase